MRRTNEWMLPIAGAVIIAGAVACTATTPAPPAPVATEPPQAQAPPPAPVQPAPAAAMHHGHDHAAEATVPRMTAAELRTAMDQGQVVVVDVRNAEGYTAGHIPGALHIPLGSTQSQVSSLPKEKTVVTYCT